MSMVRKGTAWKAFFSGGGGGGGGGTRHVKACPNNYLVMPHPAREWLAGCRNIISVLQCLDPTDAVI